MTDSKGSYPSPGDPNNKMPEDLRQWLEDYRANPHLRPYMATEGTYPYPAVPDAAIDDTASVSYADWTPLPTHDYRDDARQARSN